MASYLTEVVRPPKFYERSDESHVETLRDWIPHRWKNGDRDSIESIGEILGEAKQYELWRKVGSESWADYCSAFLNARSDAMDELIEGVKLLQGQGPVSKDLSKDDARKAAAQQAMAQAAAIGQGTRTDLMAVRAEEARAMATTIQPGTKSDLELPYNVRKLSEQGGDGGNSTSYRLRRLAREAPEILEAYERGEFKSVAAAARAAGFEKTEKPLTVLRRIWKNASTKEREQIIAWINQQG